MIVGKLLEPLLSDARRRVLIRSRRIGPEYAVKLVDKLSGGVEVVVVTSPGRGRQAQALSILRAGAPDLGGYLAGMAAGLLSALAPSISLALPAALAGSVSVSLSSRKRKFPTIILEKRIDESIFILDECAIITDAEMTFSSLWREDNWARVVEDPREIEELIREYFTLPDGNPPASSALSPTSS